MLRHWPLHGIPKPGAIAFFVLTLALSFAFGAFLSAHRVTDVFLYYDVAFVRSLHGQATMTFPHTGPFASLSQVPGREMLMVQLANMMGISAQTLQFLPLGVIVVATTLYLLALKVLRSPVVACLVTICLMFNLSHATALYSIFAYALALPLLLAFILLGMRYLEHRRPAEALLLLLLFVGVQCIHYTIETWCIVFLLGANLAIWLQRRLAAARKEAPPPFAPAHYLFLAILIIFLQFNETLYQSFLPRLGASTLEGAVQHFLGYLSVHRQTVHSVYQYTRAREISLVSTLPLVLILMPVIAGLLVDLWHLVVKRSAAWIASPRMMLVFGIVLLGLVDSSAYAIRGDISTKSVTMIFPLLAVLYVGQLNRKVLFYGMALLLVAISILKADIFYTHSYVVTSADQASLDYQQVIPSSRWLQSHVATPRYTLLADLDLYGKYLVDSVGRQRQPLAPGYTLAQYEHVVGAPSATATWKDAPYIVATDTRSSQPIISFVWLLFDPLRHHAAEMQSNRHLDLIYDDGAVWLDKPILAAQQAPGLDG